MSILILLLDKHPQNLWKFCLMLRILKLRKVQFFLDVVYLISDNPKIYLELFIVVVLEYVSLTSDRSFPGLFVLWSRLYELLNIFISDTVLQNVCKFSEVILNPKEVSSMVMSYSLSVSLRNGKTSAVHTGQNQSLSL